MNKQAIDYIEESFLKDILQVEGLTDISFNGLELFYVTNKNGRIKSDLVVNNKVAGDFLRQISNLTDTQFSFSNPILDVSIGKYRINATHLSISRKNREKVYNFSIRIGYDGIKIKEDESFVTSNCLKLINIFLNKKYSIAIGGIVGSGKTEFQKFLISKLKSNSRVIVIDNLNEIESFNSLTNLDLQTWIVNDFNLQYGFNSYIKNALRSNPDWIILTEARGKEMLSVLNSSMSGHPTITTLHSKDGKSVFSRMARMCLLDNENLKYDEVLHDLYDHFKISLYLKKDENNGEIRRYLDSITIVYENNLIEIYKYPNIYNSIPNKFINDLVKENKEEEIFLKKEWLDEK